jgi:hypothetical protein
MLVSLLDMTIRQPCCSAYREYMEQFRREQRRFIAIAHFSSTTFLSSPGSFGTSRTFSPA